jgi:hypothetical protein
MGRRLISFPVRGENNRVLGGSGSEIRFYSDAALTTLKSIFANASSGTTVANPRTPNAGKQTTLQVGHPILAADTIIWVLDVTPFAVGDWIPIYDGTNTVYRTITAIDAVNSKLTLDSAVGVGFAVNNTLINNLDMKGHIGGYFDDATDTYMQSKNVASSRVLPPVQVPTLVPATTIAVQEEGSTVGNRGTINVQGVGLKATDDAGNARVNISYWRHDLWTVGVL